MDLLELIKGFTFFTGKVTRDSNVLQIKVPSHLNIKPKDNVVVIINPKKEKK